MNSKYLRIFLITLFAFSSLFLGGPDVVRAKPSELSLELVNKFGGASWAVAVDGNKAYLGEGYRLTIFDISTPATPAVLGKSEALPDILQGITVSGSLAYVADGSGGLYILNVSTPASPTIAGSLDTPGTANEVAVVGNYAYLADGTSGLRVIDVSTPATPQEKATLDTPDVAKGIAVSGNYAYLADQSTVRIVDISNPLSPQAKGVYTPGYSAAYWGIKVSGIYAYLAESTFTILDISNPLLPTLVSETMLVGYPTELALSGNTIYAANGVSQGVQIIDVTSPTAPVLKGQYHGSGSVMDIAVMGQYAYLANTEGMTMLNISDSAHPTKAGGYVTSGAVSDVKTSAGYAYTASGERGMAIYDIAELTNPIARGGIDTPEFASSLAISGTLAIVSDGWGWTVRLINVSNPNAPSELSNFYTAGGAEDIAIDGHYAYLAATTAGLRILNIANPALPTQASLLDTPNSARGVTVENGYAYVADEYGGLRIINVSNPTSPFEVGFFDPLGSGPAYAVAISGNYAFVAYGYDGIRVLNISDKTKPTLVYTLDTYGASDIELYGWLAVVADQSYVLLVDVSNPAHPTILDSYTVPFYALELDMVRNYIFVAGQTSGVYTLRIAGLKELYLPIVRRTP